MRLRSDIFVSALTRQVFNRGGYAAVEHKGADSAGAIYLRPYVEAFGADAQTGVEVL